MISHCTRVGLDWILAKISPPKKLSGLEQGLEQAAQGRGRVTFLSVFKRQVDTARGGMG